MDTKLETMNEAVAGYYITEEWVEKVADSLEGTTDDDLARGFLVGLAFVSCQSERDMNGKSAAEFIDNSRKYLTQELKEEIMRIVAEALSGHAKGGDE
ncbi:MAG: hypothetical protein RRZ85_11145 [Gordonibacter sp.]|uniref:hypothetical protein n=1 Tax=Gordonibacter sp. TaxID=1968902 RepID=UPI002FC7918D